MSLNKPWHLAVFAFGLGIFVYLASALWSAVFIVALPQPPDAIVDSYPLERESGGRYNEQVTTEWVPIEFKNTLEEVKYYHNVRMRDRNQYWLHSMLAFGAFAGLCAFFLIPRWRRVLPDHYSASAAVGGAFFRRPGRTSRANALLVGSSCSGKVVPVRDSRNC